MPTSTRPFTLAVVLTLLAACGSSSGGAAPSPAAIGSSSSEAASPPATLAVDVRPYLSVKELRASSDSVLLGTFGQKAGTQRDNGGNPADTEGIPVAFYEFVVSRVLSGRARARLFVVSIDQNEVPSTSSLPPAGLPGLLDIDLAELELAVNQKP